MGEDEVGCVGEDEVGCVDECESGPAVMSGAGLEVAGEAVAGEVGSAAAGCLRVRKEVKGVYALVPYLLSAFTLWAWWVPCGWVGGWVTVPWLTCWEDGSRYW